MNLDEAIKHNKEKGQSCSDCGKEHLQLAEWLEELKRLRVVNQEVREQEVCKELYTELIENFNELLVDPILGRDYYNLGIDAFTCNAESVKDVAHKFDSLKRDRTMYRNLFFVMLISLVIALFFK